MASLIYRRVFADQGAFRLLLGTRTLRGGAGRGDDAPGLSLEDVRRRILVHERTTDYHLPDHFYLAYRDHRLQGVRDFSGLITTTLKAIGDQHLEWSRGRVAVKPEQFEHWQHTLPFISPLAVAVFRLRGRFLADRVLSVAERREELNKSLRHTALLSPQIPATEDLISRDGLNEMHMHLNGSTEVDLIWIDAVERPELYRDELNKNTPVTLVRELYDQIDLGLTVPEIHRRLVAARKMRWTMTGILCGGQLLADPLWPEWFGPDGQMVRLVCGELSLRPEAGAPMTRHPVGALYPEADLADISPLHSEALWLWACFDALESLPPRQAENLAVGLYFNFLALNLISRLSVQQVSEFGFDQFQKYSKTKIRQILERDYEARFRQLGVTETGDHDHLEGRFAPRSTVADNADLLDSIIRGYLRRRGCRYARSFHCLQRAAPPCLTGVCTCTSASPVRMRIGLVAHFIKLKDSPVQGGRRSYGNSCRYQSLRNTLDTSGRALLGVLRSSLVAQKLVTGIDAAANELDTPPEVFAPLFRTLRRAGMPHASFHVGEDYRHLVSGIRAVVEAVTFLDLRNGDRIGHGTALGLDPALWRQKIGPRLMLRREDALDDAVFAHSVLSGRDGFSSVALNLEKRIEELQIKIFGEAQPIQVLRAEWEMRDLDPRLATRPAIARAIRGDDPAALDWVIEREKQETLDRDVRDRLDLIHRAFQMHPQAFRHFLTRQKDKVRRAGAEWVEEEASRYDGRALHALQMYAIELLNKRNVAIETLPTSNVRISFYEEYRQHHLFRWLGVAPHPAGLPDTVRPTVCVGSDDAGIFSTNLRNEYAHINLTLINGFGLSADEARTHLEQLNRNGRIYRFQDSMPGA